MIHPIKHLSVILKHRHMVLKHCIKAGIFWRGMLHDLSKFSPTEFIPGIKYFQGSRSPNEKERDLFGYSKAWMHHKGRNRHHFEYWTDVNPETKMYEPVKMPTVFFKEMFCDRVAASKIYQGEKYTNAHPIDYFTRGRAGDKMHKETAAKLEELLIMLRDKGEEETFRYIKQMKDY